MWAVTTSMTGVLIRRWCEDTKKGYHVKTEVGTEATSLCPSQLLCSELKRNTEQVTDVFSLLHAFESMYMRMCMCVFSKLNDIGKVLRPI